MRPDIEIRHVEPADQAAWLALRCALWPEAPESEHRREIGRFFEGLAKEPQAVLLALEAPGAAVGLAELSVRAYAEGCASQNVAYLEGWYVAPDRRGRGVGRALVREAEAWGRRMGCDEFASDAAIDNDRSHRAHLAAGFEDVGVIRCFRKPI